MTKLSMPLLGFALMTLAACSTSSLTDAELAPVEPTETAFSGELKEIDKTQSVISFVGGSNIIDHQGKFNEYEAFVTLDADEPANLEKAQIVASINIASVEVDAGGLQGHLLKDDFFAAEQYPQAVFASTSIVSLGGNQYEVTGDLTIKDMTNSITFEAEITDKYLTAEYDLPREEFSIGNASYGEKLLDATVPVSIKLVFQQ